MKSSQSLLMSVPITVVIILTLTVAAATSIALFDNLVIVNAQPSQPNSTQPLTQQDEDEDAVIRQGTVTSEQDPLPGHEEHQRASILPLRQDGSIYTGVLTYTATEPVEIVILNMQNLNETEQAILNATGDDDDELGTLVTSQLDSETSLSLSYITPEYGDSPVPSASIPFVGNALWLHTLSGEPFAATFVVDAQVQPSQAQNNISTLEGITDIVTPEDDEEVAEETEDADTENATATDLEGATEEAEAEDAEDATATTTTDDGSIASTSANNNGEVDDDAGNNEEG
jgi:hypothetical protein